MSEVDWNKFNQYWAEVDEKERERQKFAKEFRIAWGIKSRYPDVYGNFKKHYDTVMKGK